MTQFDLLEIDWIDSCSDDTSWMNVEDFNYDEHDKAMRLRTIGYFLKETELATYIARSHRPGGKLVDGLFSIPNKAIIKITMLQSQILALVEHEDEFSSYEQLHNLGYICYGLTTA